MPMHRRVALIVFLLSTRFLAAQADSKLQLPLHEAFNGNAINFDWRQDVSPGNALGVRDGTLIISAKANTYAHLQRPLNIDGFRATMAVQIDGSATWSPSLFLYWDPSHFTQVTYRPGSLLAVVPCVTRREAGGVIEAFGLLDQDIGESYQYDARLRNIIPRPRADERDLWRHVSVEIDEKNIRSLISDDGGKTWLILREMARDGDIFAAPPKLLVIGKGASDPARGLANPDLNNDHAAGAGEKVESRIRDLRIVPLADVASNPAKPTPVQLRDVEGEKILARDADPDFDTVAAVYPPLQFGRELIGVKDHADDFTILPDSAIQCGNGTVCFTVGEDATRFGAEPFAKKSLHQGFLPIIQSAWEHDGLTFEQLAFAHSAGFSPDAPISASARLRIVNSSGGERKVRVAVQKDIDKPVALAAWDLQVPAGGEKSVCVQIPWKVEGTLEQLDASTFDALLDAATRHWSEALRGGASIDVPEPRVRDAWRAWLAYNYLNVDKVAGQFHPQDCSHFYPAVYGISAALYCRVLDDFGRHADARRYLESLCSMVQPDGTFIVNYGLPDAGALLMALAHHYQATGDAEWLKQKTPLMVKVADRFLSRRLESRSTQNPADRWYGLVFEKPYCDYLEKSYNFVSDLTLAGGLLAVGEVLEETGAKDEGERFRIEGQAYRRDILAAMKRSALERDGMTIIPMFPQTQALLKAVNYTALDYYGLQAGQILEKGLLDPGGPEAKTYVDMLEQRGGLTLGVARFAGGIDHAYTFGYWLNCIQRGQAKKALLGFYSSLAYGMTRDTYSGVEVTFIKSGRNYATLPHLYSGSQQLALLRAMLCIEMADDLLLCGAIPRPWLADGQHVAVSKMSTRFGDVSFRLDSSGGAMKLALDPPMRRPPASIRLRIRHPHGKAVREVVVTEGNAQASAEGEYVVFRNAAGPIRCDVRLE